MNVFAWIVFTAAAALEVGGDAVIRRGLRGAGALFIATGGVMLAIYGIMVNLVEWDFSKMLGVYMAFFAVTSLLAGRFFFKEAIPASTWLGLVLIVAGGLVIQFGS